MRVLASVAALLMIATAVAAAITVPTHGASVITTTTDWTPSLEAINVDTMWAGRWDRGTAGDATDDCYYVHFGATTDTAFKAGDLRLGGHSTCTPGTILDTSATEISTSAALVNLAGASGALTAFKAGVHWLEVDGRPGFSAGDMLYLDLTTSTAGCAGAAKTLGICDIRLRSLASPAVSFGTQVGAGNADLAEAGDVDGILPDTLTMTPAGELTAHFFDANQNGVKDSGDTIYFRMPGGPTQEAPTNYGAFVPLALDIRATAFGSHATGTIVVAGNADHIPTLEAAPGAKIGRIAGTSTSQDRLFLHWGTGTTHVQYGDIALNTVSGQTAGAMATTAATGVGLAFNDITTVDAKDLLFWLDTNSNGRFDELDGVYLNRPTAIGGTSDDLKLSDHDVRLRAITVGSTSYAAGSVVAAADVDKTSFSGATGTALHLKFFDADRSQSLATLRAVTNAKVTGTNGVWVAGEGVYIEATAAVATGSIRVTELSFAAVSVVVDGNPDVGAPAAVVEHVKITGGDGTFGTGEFAYIDLDANDKVSTNDVRITQFSSFAAGTVVSCTGTTPPADCDVALTATTGLDFVTGGDAVYSGAAEFVYNVGTSTATAGPTVADMQRISAIDFAAGSTVSCTAPANPDCAVSLQSLTDAKVTGGDGIWTMASETIYVSTDHGVADGDTRISPITLNQFAKTTPAAVAAGDADLPAGNVGDGDGIYISPVPLTGAASTGASKIPVNSDVRIMAPGFAFGTSPGTGNADYTPRLLPLSTGGTLFRWDKGNPEQLNDDAFYVSHADNDAATKPAAGFLRLTEAIGHKPGTQVSGGDSDTGAALIEDDVDATPAGKKFIDRLCFVNSPSSKQAGYDSADFLYVDTSFFSGATAGSLAPHFVRVTPTTGLSTNYAAGSMVSGADVDRTTYPSCSTDVGAGKAFQLKFLDLDGDGSFDAGGSNNLLLEHVYASADAATCATATPCSVILLLGDVAMTGGNTGYVPPSSTPAPSPTPTPSTTTSTPTPTSTTTNPQQGTSSAQHVSVANLAIAGSLSVAREGDGNLVKWATQPNVDGYQIWRSNSPFVLVATVGASDAALVDPGAPEGARYVVTAYKADGTGRLTELSVEGVLGNGALNGASVDGPTTGPAADPLAGNGTLPDSGAKGEAIPGLASMASIGVLAFACVVLRRRR